MKRTALMFALAFTPLTLDGKMHALEVRVADPSATLKGAPYTVRARKSYLARRTADAP